MKLLKACFPSTLLLATAALAVLPVQTEAQGLTYTIVPSARWIDWDDDLGFDRTRLLGGSLNLGFGRYVGLTAFYHQNDAAEFFSDSTPSVELVQAGGEVTLAFGTGTLVPVVKGGASVIRFRPEDDAVGDFSKLSFDYGAGLRAIFSETISGEVMVESSEYRLASERLMGGTFDPDEPIRQNLSLRAGLGIQLGSRTFDRAAETDEALAGTYDSPFDNFALAIEPGFSRFTFDDDLGIPDQDAWGGRAGFDFGSFFGLRGMYWRGTEDEELSEFSDFTAWGAEAQFNLGAGPGINPYLLGGVTRFDWSAEDSIAVRLDGKNAVTLGVGVDLDVSDRLRLTVAARDNILAASDLGGELIEAVSDPDDLIHNWQFSAGLSFVFGEGSSRGERQRPATVAMPEPTAPVPAEPEQVPSPESAVREVTDTAGPAALRSDTIEVTLPESGETRTIVLPVLEEGEIYIRFGPAGVSRVGGIPGAAIDTAGAAAVSEDALRQLIREEVQALSSQGGDPASRELMEELDALERRLQERLDQIAGGGGGETTVVTVEAEPRPGVSRETRELRPYSGFSVSDGTQLLLGVAADIGPIRSGSSFSLVPQVAVGVGEGKPSFLVNASLEYRFNEFSAGGAARLTPIVSAGPSLLSQGGTDIRLSTFLGAGIALGDDEDDGLNLVAGYQGVDLFSAGRLVVGLRLLR